MSWLIPVAFWGLLALAVPILVHLLTREERRSIEFPSLRFLQTTRLAATRRRRIQDWLLLVVRAATIAVAVAALAGPLIVTPARERAWSTRTARAIVTLDDARAPADEVDGAFSSHVIAARGRISESVRSAIEWLTAQPPAAREMLIVGDLREDAIDDADVAMVPKDVGIRFVPLADVEPMTTVTVPVVTLVNRQAEVEQRLVHLNPREIVVESGSKTRGASVPRIEMRAAPEDQQVADAALAALLDEGVMADAPQTSPLIVVWEGGTVPSSETGARVVRVPQKPQGLEAVDRLREIVRSAFDDPMSPREPRRVAASALASWSRPPGGVPPDAVKQDEGDRRLLWALTLGLLLVEWLLRRADRTARAATESKEVAPAA